MKTPIDDIGLRPAEILNECDIKKSIEYPATEAQLSLTTIAMAFWICVNWTCVGVSVLMALNYRGRENFNAAWRMLSDISTTRTNSTYFESHRFKLRYMMYIIDSWRWHYNWARRLSMTEQGRSQWEKTLHIYVTSSLNGWDVAPP